MHLIEKKVMIVIQNQIWNIAGMQDWKWQGALPQESNTNILLAG